MIPSSTSRRRRRDGSRRSEGAGERDEGQQQECRREWRPRILVNPRTRRDGGRRSISFAVMAAASIALAAGNKGVDAQWTDGGAVALTCDLCDCSGSSDDGTIVVFDNPSSGDRIVSVDGAHYGMLETTCGSSIIEVGGTIYELSGADDLENRDLEVLSMSPSPTCAVEDVPTTADCYSAPTETVSMSSELTINIDFSYATWNSGSKTLYKSNFNSTINGAEDLEYSYEQFCTTNGFLSQVFSVGVLDATYKYNFEFEIPGDPTSSDLSVEEAPSSQAGAFICGELVPTPAPSTALPVATDPPVAAVTATPSPVAAEPPVGATTAAPVASEVPLETAAPVGAATTAPSPPPVNATVDTVAPTPTGVPVSATVAPSVAGGGVGGGSGVNASQSPAPVDLSTATPSVAGTEAAAVTPAPSSVTEEYAENNACVLPIDDPCTVGTSVGNLNQGIGWYYDLACNSSALAEGEELPEGCAGSDLCRQCYFNTPLYQEMNADESLPEYPDCPCCILDFYDEVEVVNLDGPRCESVSPAPIEDVGTRGFDAMDFNDAGWEMNAGEAAALTALGLLAALTFFPFCSK